MSDTALPAKGAIGEWILLPLRRYARFSGRSGRREFWWFSAMQFAVYALLIGVGIGGIITGVLETDQIGEGRSAGFVGMAIAFGLLGLFWLFMFMPTLAVTIRRLHDLGISGWVALPLYLLAWFLSFIGLIIYAIVMALPGQERANTYGPPVGEEGVAKIFD